MHSGNGFKKGGEEGRILSSRHVDTGKGRVEEGAEANASRRTAGKYRTTL